MPDYTATSQYDLAALIFIVVMIVLALKVIEMLKGRASRQYRPAITLRQADKFTRQELLVQQIMVQTADGWLLRLATNDRLREARAIYIPEDHPDLQDFLELKRLDVIQMAMTLEPCCHSGPMEAAHYLRLDRERTRSWNPPYFSTETQGIRA